MIHHMVRLKPTPREEGLGLKLASENPLVSPIWPLIKVESGGDFGIPCDLESDKMIFQLSFLLNDMRNSLALKCLLLLKVI